MDPPRLGFLAVALATHGVVGYALVRTLTDADPRIGLGLALLPDVDFLLAAVAGSPIVHRGVTHSPAFLLLAVAAAYAIRQRRTDAALAGLAIGSHLALDALSPAGIPWLYPPPASGGPGIAVHGPLVTIVLWAAALAVLARPDDEPSDDAVSTG